MPENNALILAIIVAAIVLAVARWRIMPFVALIAASATFALSQGGSLPWTSKEFNTGFGQTVAAAGLAILAGGMIARLGEDSGAMAWLRKRWSGRGLMLIAALAGLGGTPIGALAALTPLLRAASLSRKRAGLMAAYAVNAAQGCVVPSPLPIAALAILDGDWRRALGFGVAVALVQMAVGAILARCAPEDKSPLPATPQPATGAVPGLILASVVLIALVVAQSLGQIPSEPLGGGNVREDLLGLGRPLILLLAGLAIAVATMGGWRRLGNDGWVANGGKDALGVLLAVGAAGGFQMSLHNTGMASLLAEKVGTLPAGFGIAVPFLIALVSRLFQGSALTATITAAGIMQPLLAPLGLDASLAAVAVGVGAMAGPHLNDGYFWLACHHAGLRADKGVLWVTGGAMIQGATALAVLAILAAVF